ncbi:hypothetical protein DL766_000337 [Monosporascus sp. MC13-8B]|uniref:BTB domain-containing protein n=1 Tax=Monosporascus cannonballus TaxID=155416 RepID=A0ABY0HFM3_9PEZI|nr:hypothetical protein DL762_001649 [Monosporascus cannonballus]RYP00003.1 hypothetical protein DL763_001133 [Monosporascus cannonballus]RYP39515.1 hypothetical protein DL766_000337 [Monosporascus sp. MC13-8B]
MSHLLWKYYWENDVDKFRRQLASAGHTHPPPKGSGPGVGVGSPVAFGSSPRNVPKSRKVSGPAAGTATSKNTGNTLGKNEVNSRDHAGLTLLLRAASSTSPTALSFVQALLDHPAIDIYIQDPESGWNALHRALYNGNISVARLLLGKERRDLTESLGSSVNRIGQLIKTKDHEGNSPFDVYNATIALRSLKVSEDNANSDNESDEEEEGEEGREDTRQHNKNTGLGEEIFTFGSNNNFSLGLGDEDDRQYPERVHLKRPERLVHHFYDEYLAKKKGLGDAEGSMSRDMDEVPTLIQNRPLIIQDVVLSKLHSAILTTDPMSNLYVCGVGRGGRLGLGDENTRFTFAPVQGGLVDRKVVQIALGQNHTMAVASNGELWTWGSNVFSQLGFALPAPSKPDEEPISTTPRQVFGPLKKDIVLGVAASAIHSVAHTGLSLFCWGKNVGQLGLMDADSRSLEVQPVPRKVAAAQLSSHSILAVSAIDRATACLLDNHSVCVLTSYGYNWVNFPFQDGLTNSPLQRSMGHPGPSRIDPHGRKIHQITSGGETIAAVTGSGDLFTMTLNHKSDGNQPATSTTNPAKIKDAVTQPQCVWSSRKDGVKSVAVGDNGSVMISTQSGAVWRRIERTKMKDMKTPGLVDNRRKDFKFQRVPYITDIVAVRSSTFGAYAAIRKDCDVTREQIEVEDPTLWRDIAPLLSLQGFKAQNHKARENKDTWKFLNPELLRGRVDALAYEILTCTDLEEDLRVHLADWKYKHGTLGTVIRSASDPDIEIPVHSWVLAARSPVLRSGLRHLRESGTYDLPEVFTISEEDGITVVELSGNVDLITLINVVVYMYLDRIVPAWVFTRQSPPLAYRYRTIRTQLMRVASRLIMPKLEAAVRTQTSPARSLHQDFAKAIEDPGFFEDGDTLLELDGDQAPVHSVMFCQRCPWFQGLFNGRSGGMWLEARRAALHESDRVSIDLKHMNPESFRYVLRYLYADVGEELFDTVVAESIDDFSELVMDVMSIANELMLDRLSQICQKIIGRFVSTRNISALLNHISPCSVSEFKDKGLEYICLQMETMLENHLLDDLDGDLLTELDQVVRQNQLARCPFARSGRAEILLHDSHPRLVEDIDEERQTRLREMAYKTLQRDEEKKLLSSFKSRFGSLDDSVAGSLAPEKGNRKSKAARNEPFTPVLRPKESHGDLIFDMDEEESTSPTPMRSGRQSELDPRALAEPGRESKGKAIEPPEMTISGSPAARPRSYVTPSKSPNVPLERKAEDDGNPWGPSPLATHRLDLREVLAEAKPAQSALSAGLAAEKRNMAARPTPQKMSQKERKKYLQQQAELVAQQDTKAQPRPWANAGEKKASPWQQTASAPKTQIKDMLNPDVGLKDQPPNPKVLAAAESSAGKSIPRRTASPDTRFSGQKANTAATNPDKPTRPDSQPLVPHSKSYIKRPPKPEPEMGLGLADIIGQQQREQQSVREAVAKRSLQEIQQEQAFQEWWDQESRRMQEEEARRVAREKGRGEKKEGGSGRRGRSNKSKSSNTRGGGAGSNNAEASSANVPANAPAGGRGRRRGNRGGKSQ